MLFAAQSLDALQNTKLIEISQASGVRSPVSILIVGSGAVWAENPEKVTIRNAKRDVVDGSDGAESFC
jgi:hypothetical protein